MKKIIKILAILFLLLSSWMVLLFSCFVAQTDAQGAFVFIFSLPLLVFLVLIGIYLGRDRKTEGKIFTQIVQIFWGSSLLIGAFFFTLPIPGLNRYPDALMGLVNQGSLFYFGKSPYVWARSRTVEKAITKEWESSKGQELNFDKVKINGVWNKVCFLPPYTLGKDTKAILGFDYNLETQSIVGYTKGVSAILFIRDDSVLGIADFKSSKADFTNIEPKCFARTDASFKRESPDSSKFIKIK